MMGRVECQQIGACTLYRGDCYEVLPELHADAVVSDPPYGINYHHGLGGKGIWSHRFDAAVLGDERPFDPVPVLRFPDVLLWGANHYAARLPPSPGWLIWDKKCGVKQDKFSDGEIAWHKGGTRTRIFRYLWNGLLAREQGEKRLYVMQKPIALMRWCLLMVHGHIILDPFMGSGTTGIACIADGRSFIGVEIERAAFDLACQRITDAYAQPDLFVPRVARPEQQALFAGAHL